jgi:hypothetical protein
MDNIKIAYLYRDGGNYKRWSRVIFSNPDKLSTEGLVRQESNSWKLMNILR